MMTKEQWIELADRLDCVEAERIEDGDALILASEAIREAFGGIKGDHVTIKRRTLAAMLVQLYRLQSYGTTVSEAWADIQIDKLTEAQA